MTSSLDQTALKYAKIQNLKVLPIGVLTSFLSVLFLLQKTSWRERYSRNRIYVRPEEQLLIKNYRVLLRGVGIGSIMAECALRFGFENINLLMEM